MRRLLVIFLLACGGPRTWAGLDHVKAIRTEPLTMEEPVQAAVSGETVLLTHCRLITPAVPVFEPLRGGLVMSGKDLPRFPALPTIARQKADPFMMDCDIWSGGPLGTLRNAALNADKQGDMATFRNLEKRYWAGYGAALERRRIQSQKGSKGAVRQLPKGTR